MAKKTCLAIPSEKVPLGVMREDLNTLLAWGKDLRIGDSLVSLDRPECETMPVYRQMIPYAYLLFGDDVLAYRRSNDHTESRLADKWSIGFGGHMEIVDETVENVGKSPYSWFGTVLHCLNREMGEELGLTALEYEPVYRGRIALDDSMVNKVHVGLVFEIRLLGLKKDEVEDRITSEEVAEVEWLDKTALKTLVHDQFDWEGWSKQVISVIL